MFCNMYHFSKRFFDEEIKLQNKVEKILINSYKTDENLVRGVTVFNFFLIIMQEYFIDRLI